MKIEKYLRNQFQQMSVQYAFCIILKTLGNPKWFLLKLKPVLLNVNIIKSGYIFYCVIYNSLLLICICMKVTAEISTLPNCNLT